MLTQRRRCQRRCFLTCMAADPARVVPPRLALAANPPKVGLMLPLTGSFAPTGRPIEVVCRAHIKRNGPGSKRRATTKARR